MSNNTAPTTRDNLRANLLARKHTFKRITVIDDETGAIYEVLQPSIKERSDLRKEVTTTTIDKKNQKIDFDFFKFMILAAIRFTVVPGTTDRVFEDEDYELLAAAPSGGFTDKLCEAASELCNISDEESDPDKAKKPSEKTLSGS